jgi:hypothetical protein
MVKIYEEDNNPLGIKLKIYYVDKVEKVIPPQTLFTFFMDIYENIYRWIGNPFMNLELEIWDDAAPEIPKNVIDCKDGVCRIITQNIGSYSGLTWAWKNQMALNDNLFGKPESERDSFIANIWSHESGHLIADKIGFNDKNNLILPEWKKLRGKDSKPGTPEGELIAEDIRLLFGCRFAKDFERGDYLQAKKVRGLKDMYKCWKPFSDRINATKLFASINDVRFEYSSWDFDYFAVEWSIDFYNPLWKWNNRRYRIDRNGVYQKNWYGGWDKLAGF